LVVRRWYLEVESQILLSIFLKSSTNRRALREKGDEVKTKGGTERKGKSKSFSTADLLSNKKSGNKKNTTPFLRDQHCLKYRCTLEIFICGALLPFIPS